MNYKEKIEQLQKNIICYLDSMPNETIDEICEIIINIMKYEIIINIMKEDKNYEHLETNC